MFSISLVGTDGLIFLINPVFISFTPIALWGKDSDPNASFGQLLRVFSTLHLSSYCKAMPPFGRLNECFGFSRSGYFFISFLI